MPQIGFTKKQSPVYHRFNALRRAYEDANGGGRVYNPDFLTVLMDAWEEIHAIVQDIEKELQPKRKSLQDRMRERQEKANTQPVRIKDGDNRYIDNAIVATTNLFLTDDRSEVMVFDSPDKAKEFLRKYGRSAEGWILEPVNELP